MMQNDRNGQESVFVKMMYACLTAVKIAMPIVWIILSILRQNPAPDTDGRWRSQQIMVTEPAQKAGLRQER